MGAGRESKTSRPIRNNVPIFTEMPPKIVVQHEQKKPIGDNIQY